jgi:hypothetical protein
VSAVLDATNDVAAGVGDAGRAAMRSHFKTTAVTSGYSGTWAGAPSAGRSKNKTGVKRMKKDGIV